MIPELTLIKAGSGVLTKSSDGTLDRVQMLHRMYTRWAARKGYTVETLDWQDGDEEGLRTAALKITGDHAQKAQADRAHDEKGVVSWGNQIRSYAFQPYQRVLDLRTGEESGTVQEVMDGDINAFISLSREKSTL